MKNFQRSILFFGLTLAALSSPSRADNLETMTVGTGKAKFDLLLQAWTLNDTTSTGPKLNFRMRRAEIKFSGSVADDSRWFVMIDPTKSLRISTTGTLTSTNDNKVLQDLGVAFSITPELEIIAGQFKIPTTAEGLESSGELLMLPETTAINVNQASCSRTKILFLN
jgi:hypothetical protein